MKSVMCTRSRIRSISTVLLLLVFSLAVLTPAASAYHESYKSYERSGPYGETPWVDCSKDEVPSRDMGKYSPLQRLSLLLIDAGLFDLGGATRVISDNSDGHNSKSKNETQDLGTAK